MGERLLCKQEVVGSIPSASTSLLVSRPRGWERMFRQRSVRRKRNTET